MSELSAVPVPWSALRDSVGLSHRFPWFMVEQEIEAREVEGPAGLSAVQLFGGHEVFQVLVIGPDLTLMFRTFDEVSPFL